MVKLVFDAEKFLRQADERATGGEPPPKGVWVDDAGWIEADLPPRAWVAPGYALRGAVTILGGPPSAAKSCMTLAWACAVALNHPHGRFVPIKAAPVIIFNVEDDQIEQRRRLSATLRHFNASPADIEGKIIRAGPQGVGTLFVLDDEGRVSPTPAMARLRELIEEHRPAMLFADPFAELHNSEENDNTGMRAIIAAFRALAIEFNIAVILVHHTRKGGAVAGDPDSARGASAIIGAARIVQTLMPMSEEEAEALGVNPSRKSRSRYVRLDDAKQNYSGIGDAVWFEKVLYGLANGEVIPAVEPWVPPDIWAAITPVVANAILDDLAAGFESDKGTRYYSDASAVKGARSAAAVVRKHVPSLTDKQARTVIKDWIENDVLRRGTYDDPVDRKKDRSRLFVIDANRPGPRAPG